MPRLRITHRSSVFAGKTLEFEQAVVRFGRDPATCQVLFDENADRAVSRMHLELRTEGDTVTLVPTPGKVVLRGGQAVTGAVEVAPGDLFELCGTGGPSFDVVYEKPAPAFHAKMIGGSAAYDDVSSTVVGMPAFVAPPRPAEPAPAPPPPRVSPAPPVRAAPQPPAPAPVPAPLLVPQGAVAMEVADAPTQSAVARIAAPSAPAPGAVQIPSIPAVRAQPMSAIASSLPTAASLAKAKAPPLAETGPDAPTPAAGFSPFPEPPPQPSPFPSLPKEEPRAAPPPPPPPPAPAAPPVMQREFVPDPPSMLETSRRAPATMQLSVPDGVDPSSTQLMSMPVMLPPEPEEHKVAWKRAALVGGGVLAGMLLIVSIAFFAFQADRKRQAIERVERLKAALGESHAAMPVVSDEDFALYNAEMARRASEEHRPPPPPTNAAIEKQLAETARKLKEEAARRGGTTTAPPGDTTPAPPAVDLAAQQAAEEAARKAAESSTVDLRTKAREVFADMRRNELARLTASRSKKREAELARQEISDRRKALQAEYDELIAKLTAAMKPGPVEVTIRQTARYLGECDAAMPPKFVIEATAAVQKLKTDAAQRQRLIDSLKRSVDFRFGPTITAALGDQGLPVELFFIPLRLTGLDEKKVGAARAEGIPRGMWMLLPPTAQKLGLTIGPGAASPDFDDADDRHHHEKESRAAAKLLRDMYRGPAALSAMLMIAAYDSGESGVLAAMKQKAGLKPSDSDPGAVSFWKIYESGAIDEARRRETLETFASIAVASAPKDFGFDFAAPLEHVQFADP